MMLGKASLYFFERFQRSLLNFIATSCEHYTRIEKGYCRRNSILILAAEAVSKISIRKAH